MEFLRSRVARNLHLVLCFSPVGESFRIRARRFPGLINCTAINRFFDWPEDALQSVAKRFLEDVDLSSPEISANVAEHMASVHLAVTEKSVSFLEKARRRNYVTPKSFLVAHRLLLAPAAGESASSRERTSSGFADGLSTLRRPPTTSTSSKKDLEHTMENVAEQVANTQELLKAAAPAVADVTNAVLIMVYKEKDKNLNWKRAKKMMNNPTSFVAELLEFAKPPEEGEGVQGIDDDTVRRIEKYTADDAVEAGFKPEAMKKSSSAASNLCEFVISCYKYNRIYVKRAEALDPPTVERLKHSELMLIGDVLLSAAFVSYIGAFRLPVPRRALEETLQGIKWLRERERDNNLKVIQLSASQVASTTSPHAITNGWTIIVENCDEDLDATLDRDQAQCTMINFIATEVGLQDQLLAQAVNKEKPELESAKQEPRGALQQVKLNAINHMYQYSLDSFMLYFFKAIREAPASDTRGGARRLPAHHASAWPSTPGSAAALFEDHKLVLLSQLTFQLMARNEAGRRRGEVLDATFKDSLPNTPSTSSSAPVPTSSPDLDQMAVTYGFPKGEKYHNILDTFALDNEGRGSHEDFRLFLTSEPAAGIPIGILNRSIKLTNEPPTGLKANLKRAFCSFKPELINDIDSKQRSILFGLCTSTPS
ncbi:hypothetical protein FNF31_07945 [Cafeteria roenbergensis]|uniref:Dynein heavy chain AAA module D4 domain-containing protein n=1 Tax=Cafeteria roenbergensis TaxID=33653 RepID=A0A5A8BZM3_CAFRO|nr:hypothetical protein FNF31_07945 [Cafeteria roenbergensis]